MPQDSRPAGMRLFGVTIAPGAGADGGGAGDGYLSDGGLMQSSGKRRRAQERKKAVPWTEEEHRTFLAGLEKLGKGDWRGIAKNFVTSRTPTQTNPNKKKRRSSLFDMMPGELSPAPNCPILPPSMAKVHDVVAMTRQLQNSNLEGGSSSNTANIAPQVGRDLPPVPSFWATNMDSSFSKLNRMEPLWRTPYPFRPIPRSPDGTSPSLLTSLSPRSDTSSLPPKADPPAEMKDLELTVAPPSQQNMTNMSSQNAVGVIQVI
ncbi:hypothetical protein PVAP13_6NG053330 [Panicum virgatum]|uniref:Uncharacterized protein n=1 Tax=Panicum virgatum TaxID=38727 RepID=A0A8T0QUL7_PANVG|nr:hypothetical protein PVAP13_6NG053330 [Panicum virgatum]